VAYSFEAPDIILATWDLAIKTACELCPWLLEEDAIDGGWTMNLFTINGLWEFPSTNNVADYREHQVDKGESTDE